MINMEGFSLEELKILSNDINKELHVRDMGSINEARKEAKRIIDKYNVDISDLVSGTSNIMEGKVSVAKYQHKLDSRTWSGRGRKPLWIKEWEERGNDLEDLRIS